jgi:hypothetical protein
LLDQRKWEEIKAEFAYGNWPELYVLETTAEDWRRVLDFVRADGYAVRFQHGQELQPGLLNGPRLKPFPTDPNGFFAGDTEHYSLLEVDVGGITFSTLFFTRDQIEFHLDPRKIQSPERADTLFEFMRGVGRALNKSVRLTHENLIDVVIVEYDPVRDELWRENE